MAGLLLGLLIYYDDFSTLTLCGLAGKAWVKQGGIPLRRAKAPVTT